MPAADGQSAKQKLASTAMAADTHQPHVAKLAAQADAEGHDQQFYERLYPDGRAPYRRTQLKVLFHVNQQESVLHWLPCVDQHEESCERQQWEHGT
jgi:hypothetical protein